MAPSRMVGNSFSFTKVIEERDVAEFAQLTGDWNPLHMETDFARTTSFQRRVVHGMLVAGIASRLVGMHIPGAGALWSEQNLQFKAPVFIGDILTFSVEILQVSEAARSTKIRITVTNQHGAPVLTGDGLVVKLDTTEHQMLDHHCKVGFVTGASRGIGRAIAERLAAAGVAVGVNFNASENDAQGVVASIVGRGGKAIAVRGDVRSAEDMRTAAAICAQQFQSPVDALVCNAGTYISSKTFAELEWKDFEAHWEMQVKGTFNAVKAVVTPMLEQKFGKVIVVNSSFSWSVPPIGWNHYVTAKYGLAGFTKTLAAELGPHGVTVNAVSPGLTETDLLSTMPDRLRKITAAQVPLRRLGVPDDVAKVVAFLASPDADYLNGVDIPVAGGSVMR